MGKNFLKDIRHFGKWDIVLASIPFSKMPYKILGFGSVIPNTLRKTLKVFTNKNTFWEEG